MIEQDVDHRRHEQGEVDPLARDRGEDGVRIKTLEHVHGPALHQHGQDLRAGDVADRPDREVARIVGNFEAGENRSGEIAQLAVMAERALGFAGRAAGVVERGDGVGVGEIARRHGAGRLRRCEQVAAVVGVLEREDRPQARRARGQLGAARPEGARVDDEGVGFGILDLIELVGERAERMQPGDGGAAKVRGNAGAPGLVPIGSEKRDAAAAVEPCRDEHRLKAPDQVVRRAIAERAAVPGESGARGIAAERRQRLRTDGRAGIERRPHGVPPGIDRTRFLRAAIVRSGVRLSSSC